MPAYHYRALNAQGKTVDGVQPADSERQARDLLREQQLLPLELTLVKNTATTSWWQYSPKLSTQDLSLLLRQLATLLTSGLPIAEALAAVSEQTDKLRIKRILQGVRSHILEGQSFANALRQFPQAFPELFSATIAAGEHTGCLDDVLEDLAEYAEQQAELQQKIQQALIYPITMVFVSFSIVTFLLLFVVPKIIDVFDTTGQTLPTATRFLLGISHLLQHFGIALLLLTLLGFLLCRYLLRQPIYYKRWQQTLLRLPLLRFLITTIESARYARTLGILIQAGVTAVEAMQVASQLVQNGPLREQLQRATMKVSEGVPLAKALRDTNAFAPLMLHLIASGEASGQLAMTLRRSADYQEQTIKRVIATALSLFEPAIILVMGSIVLFIVLAILLPVFSLEQIAI